MLIISPMKTKQHVQTYNCIFNKCIQCGYGGIVSKITRERYPDNKFTMAHLINTAIEHYEEAKATNYNLLETYET